MQAEVTLVAGFLVSLLVTHTRCTQEAGPPGHMLPLGSHQPPQSPGIDILQSAPIPEDFFVNHVEGSRPFLIKNHAKDMPAFKLWNDEYLKSKYGHIKVDVEQTKKEDRSSKVRTMTLKEFLSKYNHSDIYLVQSLPTEMMGDIWLIKSLLCGGFISNLEDAVTWFSSGGTKSVFHFDDLDNINCLFDGTKELIMVPKTYSGRLKFAPEGRYSSIDVDRVDMIKYPQFTDIPWYNVSMEPGDCLFIPYRWAHQVRSSGRNLAINIWFKHQRMFDYEDCKVKGELPEFAPLSSVGINLRVDAQMRRRWISFVKARGGVITEENFPAAEEFFGINEEEAKALFTLLDVGRDGRVTLEEVESAHHHKFAELLDDLDLTDLDFKEEISGKGQKSHLETNKSEL